MKQKNDSEINWSRIMFFASIAFPVLGSPAVALQIIASGFSRAYISAGLVILFVIFIASRYLYRRSKNLEAAFMTTRIYPDTQPAGGLVDQIVMLGSALFVLAAFFLPMFRHI